MMLLLRKLVGTELRFQRMTQKRSLKDVAKVANISVGYLSEIERGMKDPSSEVLEAIVASLDMPLIGLLNGILISYSWQRDKVET